MHKLCATCFLWALKVMRHLLDNLNRDLLEYRKAVDQLLSLSLAGVRDWRYCFLDILIAACHLYFDRLCIIRHQAAIRTVKRETSARRKQHRTARIGAVQREKTLRESLQRHLVSAAQWSYFQPENAFSDLTGLRSSSDYVKSLALHLSEIYHETFRLEKLVRDFLKRHRSSTLTDIIVGLDHIGRNHFIFVLPALEWIADEDSYTEEA